MTSDTQKYLLSVYDGQLAKDGELGNRLAAGEVRKDEFASLFDIKDRSDDGLTSLGMFVTVQATYLLLTDGLAEWTRKIATNVTANRRVRDWLDEALYPKKHYTHDTALTTMRDMPQVQRVLIAGTLMEIGFARARGWVGIAGFLMQDGKNVVEEIILQVLREASIEEIRAFLGANPQYDNSELLEVLGDLRVACAQVAAHRAPELFFYHGYKLGVDEERLSRIYQWLIDEGGYYLTEEQKYQLVNAEWFSPGVQDFLREQWDLPA